MAGGYDALTQCAANFEPLSPVGFLARSAAVYPDKTAVIAGPRSFTWCQIHQRALRLAGALTRLGAVRGTTVAALLPNGPEMLEMHFGVPMTGAVLCSLNTRLDAAALAFILRHSKSRFLVADREYGPLVLAALEQLEAPPLLIEVCDPVTAHLESIGGLPYEPLLSEAAPHPDPRGLPADEWDAIALNYTSGTTGDPKGVVLHHRGAFLNACGNVMSLGFAAGSVYLWTLPMFHCNGWTHTWALTQVGAIHVCQRKVDPADIFAAISEHGVTHLCGAPVVLGMIANAPEEVRRPLPGRVRVATGGAAPPIVILERMEAMGFDVTHLYGMTECYGPAAICTPQPGLEDLGLPERAAFLARQGVAHVTAGEVSVLDPLTGLAAPWDGETLGELTVRGNTVMKGYLDNPAATANALKDGWLWTGDLAVIHPDGYIEIRDRSKDIIISGGENISSLEVEQALYRHPAVAEAAVVAKPHAKWGETPHAFVLLREGMGADEAEIVGWCRSQLAGFKVPRHVTFGELPKTATGKIQKHALRAIAAATGPT